MASAVPHHRSHASFAVARHSGVINVRMRGDLDLETAGVLAEILERVHARTGDLVQLDARHVHFIDCSALMVIDQAKQAFAESGVTLWVVSPSLCVRALLDMTAAEDLLAPGDQTELRGHGSEFRHQPC